MFAPSAWQNFMAIAGLPFVLWLTTLGTGLAIERVARAELHNALLLPLGLAGGICLNYALYALHISDVVPVVLTTLVSLAGFVFARGGLRSRINPGLPGVAGLAAYVLFMLPVIAAGHWTWTDYNFDNDTSYQFLLLEALKVHGTAILAQLDTASAVADSYIGTGYPLGGHVELATLSGLVHTPPEALYQGYLAALAALIAMAVAAGAARTVGALPAVAVGFLAAGSNLFYQYVMQGEIKETATAAVVLAAVVLIAEAIRARRLWSGVLVCAVPLAAILGTYGVAGAPFVLAALGGLGAYLVVVERRLPTLSWLKPAALGAALVCALSIPAILNFETLFNVASSVVGGSGTPLSASPLGDLLRALPLSQISGVWLSSDWRLPIAAHPAAGLTNVASAVIFLLLIPAVVSSFRRREAGPLIALVTAGLVLAIVVPRVTPYGGGKLFAIVSPLVVWVAGIGLLSLRWRRLTPLVYLVGAALGLAIVASDILAYHGAPIAPTGRMLAIEATADRFAGKGLVLFNEDEAFLPVFGRNARTIAPYESVTPYGGQGESILSTNVYQNFFDLDEFQLPYIEQFPIVVTRRSPIASRPPANYRLVYENRYYEAWQRHGAPRVLDHLGIQGEWQSTGPPACASVSALVSRAPANSSLIQATAPPQTGFRVLDATTRPFSWGITVGEHPYDAVHTIGPGFVHERVTVPATGTYDAWVQGTFPRSMQVLVDGRQVGSVFGSDSIYQWSRAGTVRLTKGPHVLAIHRGGGTTYPGDGALTGELGYVLLAKQGGETLRHVPVALWRTLCGKPADWIELVRP